MKRKEKTRGSHAHIVDSNKYKLVVQTGFGNSPTAVADYPSCHQCIEALIHLLYCDHPNYQ